MHNTRGDSKDTPAPELLKALRQGYYAELLERVRAGGYTTFRAVCRGEGIGYSSLYYALKEEGRAIIYETLEQNKLNANGSVRTAQGQARPVLEEADIEGSSRGPGYGYDEDLGIYTFQVEGSYVNFKADTWRYVCKAYSSEGMNMTRALIAEQVNVPAPILEVCLRKYGFFKSSQPMTHEDFMVLSDEEIDNETLETKRSRWRSRMLKKERSDLIRRLEEAEAKLAARERTRKILLDEACEVLAGYEALSEPVGGKREFPSGTPSEETWECHAPLADVHVGLLVWGKESWRGVDYETKSGAARISEHGERVADWISDQPGACSICHVTDVGDVFHSLTEATVSGTELQIDGRPLKAWRETLAAEVERVEAIRRVADKVEIRRVPGNHDGVQADLLTEALAVWYRNTPDVEVSLSSNEQNYFLVGDTLHLLTHGKGIFALADKAKSRFEVMAREVAGQDFYNAKKIKVYFGHLHSPSIEHQGRHMELIRLPSLAEPDDYAQGLYLTHDPEARVFRLSQDGDIDSEKRLAFAPA